MLMGRDDSSESWIITYWRFSTVNWSFMRKVGSTFRERKTNQFCEKDHFHKRFMINKLYWISANKFHVRSESLNRRLFIQLTLAAIVKKILRIPSLSQISFHHCIVTRSPNLSQFNIVIIFMFFFSAWKRVELPLMSQFVGRNDSYSLNLSSACSVRRNGVNQ